MTKKQKQRTNRPDFNEKKNLPNPDGPQRLQRMTNGEYILQLASNPTEENLQRLKEAVENAQTYNRIGNTRKNSGNVLKRFVIHQ